MSEEMNEVVEEAKVEESVAEAPAVEEPAVEAPAEAEVKAEPVKVADDNQSMESLGEDLEKSLKAGPPKNDDPIWDKFEELMKAKEIFEVKVESAVKGGVIAFVEEVRAFIPASKLATTFVEKLEEFKGKTIPVTVITVDKEKKKLVLSGRDAAKAKQREARKAAADNIKEGDVLDGKVESLKDYGAFIDLGDGLNGLLHVSQISYKRVEKPSDALKVGEEVKVKVLSNKDGKISLSIKALTEAPEKAPRAERPRREKKEDHVEYTEKEGASTSLADLFAGIKID